MYLFPPARAEWIQRKDSTTSLEITSNYVVLSKVRAHTPTSTPELHVPGPGCEPQTKLRVCSRVCSMGSRE